MNNVDLSEFLLRVHQSGVKLDGWLIGLEGQDHPHVFSRVEKCSNGRAKVFVKQGGKFGIASLVSGLEVASISEVGPKSGCLVGSGSSVLYVVFKYPVRKNPPWQVA